MSLHIVLGFDGLGGNAEAESVYVGKSASEAQAAQAEAEHPRTLWIRNPRGIRKVNKELSQKMTDDLNASRAKERKKAEAGREESSQDHQRRKTHGDRTGQGKA